ncbi:MAG: rod shape-determining protein RodA [Thermaerobacter sp.]|nr:rod shape-determining protein RodA [Thermaerobacter sp.]
MEENNRVIRNLDYISLAVMYLTSGLSLFLIAGATQTIAPASDPLYFVKRQIIWIVLGTVAVAVIAAIPYARFRQLSPVLYWGSIALLAYVLVKGHTTLGAQRWINVGPFQLQPSEFAKIAVVITLATHLSRKERLDRWRDLISPLIHVGIPMLLILKQPDLGTTLVFVAITAGMFYLAGVPALKMLLMFPGGLLAMIGWIYLHLRFPQVWIPMHQYQLNRLIIFLNPNKDPLGAGFNVIQSRIAVGTGGLWGTGIGAAHASQLSFLPESYTDFIFAVIGKELGFVGSMAILAVYLLLIARGLFIAVQAKDRYGTLLAAGVVAMFSFHVLESAGMASGIMPVAGVPLPFMSYGGSAFLTDAAGIGILINVYARRKAHSYRTAGEVPAVLYSTKRKVNP